MEPSNDPCPIDVFYYTLELINLDQCEMKDPPMIIHTGTTMDYVLTLPNLMPHSTYRVSIGARNEAGDGVAEIETMTTNSTCKYPCITKYLSLASSNRSFQH